MRIIVNALQWEANALGSAEKATARLLQLNTFYEEKVRQSEFIAVAGKMLEKLLDGWLADEHFAKFMFHKNLESLPFVSL